jgi:predicted O-methyltransferase YrrM
MQLTWRELAPIPDNPLTVWTSLTEGEAAELRRLAPGRRVIEVGAGFGFSTVLLAAVAEHVWSVDYHLVPPDRGYYGFEQDEDMARYAAGTLATIETNLASLGLTDRVSICRENSQQFLADGSAHGITGANFAFIDGDHIQAAAAADLANCERILGPGGTIAAHDYDEAGNPGVRLAIDEWRGDRPMRLVDTLAIINL